MEKEMRIYVVVVDNTFDDVCAVKAFSERRLAQEYFNSLYDEFIQTRGDVMAEQRIYVDGFIFKRPAEYYKVEIHENNLKF